MATLKQFEANRRNAQKSTSPKTPEGKSAVSMNALRHGLRARTVVLPGEDPTEFHQLCDDLQAEWTPQSRTEQFYVEQMAVSQWKVTRMEVVEVNIFKDTDAKSQLSRLDQLWQAECRLERSYSRAQRELQRLQNSRPEPAPQPEEAVASEAVPPVEQAAEPPPKTPPTPEANHPSPQQTTKSNVQPIRGTDATPLESFNVTT